MICKAHVSLLNALLTLNTILISKKMASFYKFANKYDNQFVLGQPDQLLLRLKDQDLGIWI